MGNTFYKLPIRFDSIFDEKGGDMPLCSELESIDQHIELLLTTCPGELKFDKNFGCRIWDMDFERVVSRKNWEDDFAAHIEEAVNKYEKRLMDVTIAIHIMEVTREDKIMKATAIKKKVIVQISGTQVSTGGHCGFNYTLFLGPLSSE